MTSLQILVVDDEPAIRQILAANLTRAGHGVEVAGIAGQVEHIRARSTVIRTNDNIMMILFS